MNHKKVTIRDVAKVAGTSASTVSRVLTGNAPVSDEKRKAVEAAIENLGYRPSLIARSLKTKTTCTIGLIINEIINPFYSAVGMGAEEEANQHGYNLILCNSNEDPERELQYLYELRDRNVDGIIFGPCGKNEEAIKQLTKQVPLVFIDRKLNRIENPAVLVDNEAGAYNAISLLVEKGHSRIGLLGWESKITTVRDRIKGYKNALRDAGINIDPQVIVTPPKYNVSKSEEKIRQLLKQKNCPSAIFAINNQFGLAAIRAIRESNLRIPEDVALIVFDDLEIFRLTTPPISVVSQPAFKIGQRATKLLVEQIERPEERLAVSIVLPTHIIERAST